MLSALSENAEFFRERINLFIFLAPVARVDRCLATTVRTMANQPKAVKLMRKMGPEMMPEPQVGNKFMSGLLQLTGAAKKGMGLISDEDPTKLS